MGFSFALNTVKTITVLLLRGSPVAAKNKVSMKKIIFVEINYYLCSQNGECENNNYANNNFIGADVGARFV